MLGDEKYKEYRFSNKASADKFATKMHKDYGYRPEVFHLTKKATGEDFYSVVKPPKLIRVR